MAQRQVCGVRAFMIERCQKQEAFAGGRSGQTAAGRACTHAGRVGRPGLGMAGGIPAGAWGQAAWGVETALCNTSCARRALQRTATGEGAAAGQ